MEMIHQAIASRLDLSHVKKPPIGFSPETIWMIEKGFEGKNVVLKFSRRIEVYEEGQIYRFLKDKIPVPEVYLNECHDGIHYLLMEMVDGKMLQEILFTHPVDGILEIYANLVKRIHQIPVDQFPFDHGLAYKRAKVKQCVINDLVNVTQFEREFKGKSASELYSMLKNIPPFQEDLVFCHGDVCMPNFIYNENGLQAVLDVSGAGINDRYLDLAIALRTLRYNFELYGLSFGEKEVSRFLALYGVALDREKLLYYILLDELMVG